jgi:hypothetical protein
LALFITSSETGIRAVVMLGAKAEAGMPLQDAIVMAVIVGAEEIVVEEVMEQEEAAVDVTGEVEDADENICSYVVVNRGFELGLLNVVETVGLRAGVDDAIRKCLKKQALTVYHSPS